MPIEYLYITDSFPVLCDHGSNYLDYLFWGDNHLLIRAKALVIVGPTDVLAPVYGYQQTQNWLQN